MWVFGSSIVKHAFTQARASAEGTDLGLENVSIWWQGYSGLNLARGLRKLKTLLKVEGPPEILIIHLGGNDIGHSGLKLIKDAIVRLFNFITHKMPYTRIVWSQILPRAQCKELEKGRKRVNTVAVKLAKSRGGFYLGHPKITMDPKLISQDGVHLTSEGNIQFFRDMKKGIPFFARGLQPWFD